MFFHYIFLTPETKYSINAFESKLIVEIRLLNLNICWHKITTVKQRGLQKERNENSAIIA